MLQRSEISEVCRSKERENRDLRTYRYLIESGNEESIRKKIKKLKIKNPFFFFSAASDIGIGVSRVSFVVYVKEKPLFPFFLGFLLHLFFFCFFFFVDCCSCGRQNWIRLDWIPSIILLLFSLSLSFLSLLSLSSK